MNPNRKEKTIGRIFGKIAEADMLEAEAKYRKDHQLDDHDILNNNIRSRLYAQLCKGYRKNARA